MRDNTPGPPPVLVTQLSFVRWVEIAARRGAPYAALEDAFSLADALIEARASAGLAIDHRPPDRDGPTRKAIRPASRLLSAHELNLSAVRQALKDGEASGSADYCLNGLLEELDNEGADPLG
jgi:hypothetical protein